MFTDIYIQLVRGFMAVMLCFTSLFSGGKEIKANPVEPLADTADIRVVSFNLRTTGIGKTSVAYRAPLLTAQLTETKADSMGFQEANYRWISYLEDNLTDYAYVGGGRTDGGVLGEYSPVFYLKDKYTAVDYGTFWLSKTPDKPGSKDWGSNNIRICTWAVLENKETGERYVHMNTHLDHISGSARAHQIEVLLNKADEFIGKYPVVVTGDFNDNIESDMYRKATEKLNDARLLAPVTDDKATYHNYGNLVNPKLIDFIFVTDDVTPLVYHVIDDKINDVYLSDHYGIYTDLKF